MAIHQNPSPSILVLVVMSDDGRTILRRKPIPRSTQVNRTIGVYKLIEKAEYYFGTNPLLIYNAKARIGTMGRVGSDPSALNQYSGTILDWIRFQIGGY